MAYEGEATKDADKCFKYLLIPELPKVLAGSRDFETNHKKRLRELEEKMDKQPLQKVDQWIQRTQNWFSAGLGDDITSFDEMTRREQLHADSSVVRYIARWRDTAYNAKAIFSIRMLWWRLTTPSARNDLARNFKPRNDFVSTFASASDDIREIIDKDYNEWAKAIELDDTEARKYKDSVLDLIKHLDLKDDKSDDWKVKLGKILESRPFGNGGDATKIRGAFNDIELGSADNLSHPNMHDEVTIHLIKSIWMPLKVRTELADVYKCLKAEVDNRNSDLHRQFIIPDDGPWEARRYGVSGSAIGASAGSKRSASDADNAGGDGKRPRP